MDTCITEKENKKNGIPENVLATELDVLFVAELYSKLTPIERKQIISLIESLLSEK